MKILYHHRIASKDGQFVHVEELTQALEKAGHEIIMVGPGGVDSSEFGDENGLVALLKSVLPRFFYELLELSYAFIAYFKLRAEVIRHRPDCIYERYNLLSPAGIWIKKQFGLPLLSEVNAPLLEERNKYGRISLYWLARWSEHYVWKNADKVLPVTEVLADKVANTGVRREKIKVIPNGINPDRFPDSENIADAKSRLSLEGKEVLGFTGFMREWHGLDRILDIVARDYSGRRFALLVGDGPARRSLEQYAKDLGISERIRITGVVERDDMLGFISAFDVALLPSVVPYASPLKLFEYMALGKAIVAPDMPNIREILENNDNALLFQPDCPDAFREAVEAVLDDPDTGSRLGVSAKRTIEDRRLTWHDNARRVGELITQLMDATKSRGPAERDG